MFLLFLPARPPSLPHNNNGGGNSGNSGNSNATTTHGLASSPPFMHPDPHLS